MVVMGVAGAGKSTVGRLLAARLGVEFCDGDALHSAANIALMAAGHPLGDVERTPWLHAVGQRMHDSRRVNRGIVVACSALKRRYRDILREHQSDIIVVFLDGPMLVVHERITSREHDYMPPSLLASQYRDLEPLQDDETGIRANIQQSPRKIVGQIAKTLASKSLAPLPKANN